MLSGTGLYVGSDYRGLRYLKRHLQSVEIELHRAFSISTAKEMLLNQPYDLVIIQFETISNRIFELHSFLRSENPDAIIIVLMTKIHNSIEKQLFDSGVDDVVVCGQICASTLASRIKKRLNRLSPSQTSKIMFKNGATLDLDRKEVSLNGSTYTLKGVVEKLLEYFLENPNRVISRDELIRSPIWDNSVCFPGQDGGKAIDMTVSKLRKVIGPSRSQVIMTVPGRGWVLAKDAIQRREDLRCQKKC